MKINLSIPRKVIYGVISVFVVALITTLAACSGSSNQASQTENNASGQIWEHYDQVQPLYQATGKSAYRDTLTFAEATHVLGLNTYTFFLRKGGNGGPLFECPSKGSAVPNTAELSNPHFIVPDPNNGNSNNNPGSLLVGNMDPDGVYPPDASQGTYVQCLLGNGKPYLAYGEDDIVQLNVNGARWDPTAYGGQGGIVVTGSPQMPVCQVRFENSTATPSPAASADASGTSSKVAITSCKKTGH